MPKDVRLVGIKELFSALDGLPATMKAKTLQSVNKTVLRKTMRNTMRDPEIKGKTMIGNEQGNPLGVLFGVKKKYDWLNWREYGTKKRRTKGTGANRGVFKKTPFWDIHITRMTPFFFKTINTEYGELINKFLKRTLKRISK